MEYLTYSYMIDNVALLITGTLHERDTKELLERCHPLGWFETMPVLCVATNIEELYNSVLIETPLAPYFKGSLSHQDLDELNIEIVRNTLYKNYLEDFHHFVNNDPEMALTPTAEIMSEILEFEADRRAINITLNSFGTELSKDQRRKLYPDFGKLYPEGMLMLSRADDIEGVGLAVSGVGDYKRFFDEAGLNQSGMGVGNMAGGTGGDQRSLEDMFYQKEMELSKLVFTRQFTHAVIYAWVKLREQVSHPCKKPRRRQDPVLRKTAGNPEYHVDCRVYSPEPEGEDRELYQCLLVGLFNGSLACSTSWEQRSRPRLHALVLLYVAKSTFSGPFLPGFILSPCSMMTAFRPLKALPLVLSILPSLKTWSTPQFLLCGQEIQSRLLSIIYHRCHLLDLELHSMRMKISHVSAGKCAFI